MSYILHILQVYVHCFWKSLSKPSEDHSICSLRKVGPFCSCGKYHPEGLTWEQEMEKAFDYDPDQDK